jgi:hypothetical protein
MRDLVIFALGAFSGTFFALHIYWTWQRDVAEWERWAKRQKTRRRRERGLHADASKDAFWAREGRKHFSNWERN